MQLADLSITGARIFGAPPCARGEAIELELTNLRVSATVVRCEAGAFAVAFNHSLKSRIATIQYFYSGGHLMPLGSIQILRVAESILRRVFD
jgi:hypothetical protein